MANITLSLSLPLPLDSSRNARMNARASLQTPLLHATNTGCSQDLKYPMVENGPGVCVRVVSIQSTNNTPTYIACRTANSATPPVKSPPLPAPFPTIVAVRALNKPALVHPNSFRSRRTTSHRWRPSFLRRTPRTGRRTPPRDKTHLPNTTHIYIHNVKQSDMYAWHAQRTRTSERDR